MADQVAAMCEQLVKAVNVMMDAETSQIYRLEALKFFEEFKETSSLCVPCGLQLAEKAQPAVVRHFGLQILEHVIKFRWNNMQQQEKVQVKDCAMQLLSKGTLPILEEESHIKDALARIIVEMIKREWPQHWPDMLKEMEALTSQGEAQTELVMLILLRLAEDVITFQTLPTQRRRDIQQTLTQNMESIFTFLMAILHLNVEDYRKLKGSPEHELQARANCRVAVATLNTLAGYIDWVSLVHITSGNCQLLEMLCLLLSEPELQLEAAECLLIAISRKGKLEDRKPFMLLFDDVAIHYFLSSAQSADGLAICKKSDAQGVEVVERRYIFLKRVCQVLCALGGQLCTLVGSDAEVEVPANLSKYLEAFLAFTTHSSLFLKSSTVATWGALFRHETLSKDAVVAQMAVKFLRASMTSLVKAGFPSRNDSPSCQYSRVDFDSDEDFNSFFNSFRAQHGEVVRSACRVAPLEAFQIAAEWLQYQITCPIDTGDASLKTTEGLCSLLSPSMVQWDAMTVFMECMVSSIFKNLTEEQLPIDQSMKMLQDVLNYDTKDPLILSCVLTNVSALFPFVTHRLHFLPQVLYKLFKAITFESDENKGPRTRAVNNLRRHACSSIIKICRDYAQIILPCFEMFYSHVKKLFTSDTSLTHMEKCSLMESLVLISNQFKDFAKQKAFLDELMASVIADWTSDEMKHVLWDPALFLSFVGADQVVTEQSKDGDTAGLNRSRVGFCLYAMLSVVKRARWPADPDEAKAGGFVVGYTPAGAPIYRNPCSAQFLIFLPNLLALIRTHNSLFTPENRARLSDTFTRVHEMMDPEKNVVLGLSQPVLDIYVSPVYKSSLERMQGFFTQLYDNCLHVLGNGGVSLQQDFYTIERLAEQLAGSVFASLDHVPDNRLRPMIRVFLRQLVLSCPQEYYDSLLCPLLSPLFTFMLQTLNMKWQVINQRTAINDEEEEEEVVCQESQVSQEILEEQLVRLVTREVLDLLTVSCISKKVPEPTANKEEMDEEDMMMDSVQTPSQAQPTDELTELGKCLMKHESIYMNLLTLSFTSLSWKDTSNCHRTASMVCWTLLRPVVGGNLLPEAVTWFFTSVLRGLQVHGQHEVCNATLSQLAMQIYENLRPRYIELRAVMTQIPNINLEALDQYDRRLLDSNAQKAGEKKRKDQFKKLIAGTVGKALCQQFRKEVHIRNLPSLYKRPKPEMDTLSCEALGLAALFVPENDAL